MVSMVANLSRFKILSITCAFYFYSLFEFFPQKSNFAQKSKFLFKNLIFFLKNRFFSQSFCSSRTLEARPKKQPCESSSKKPGQLMCLQRRVPRKHLSRNCPSKKHKL